MNMDTYIASTYSDWYIGLAGAFIVIVVVVIIVAIILTMAARIADQAAQADAGVGAHGRRRAENEVLRAVGRERLAVERIGAHG